ncbi:hypothetical protein ACFOD0_12550 [Shewanella intestini]|uniref:Uncharacterized protein n=1 Tax=Shewanella intestini TaxID=2017544 RepID=A0ABS5I094_9GAMM|nr:MULTISPECIES: hypothetical protein [Shewanella]MBR9727447.1 hypothetical protein [Shewanella intestini]MRG35503.1 hypothetical protein [Shewanella sp. XMDDZSB0408]
MIKNWLNKILGRDSLQKRTKVEIDLNYETHIFKMDDIHKISSAKRIDIEDILTEEKLTK